MAYSMEFMQKFEYIWKPYRHNKNAYDVKSDKRKNNKTSCEQLEDNNVIIWTVWLC